MPPTPFSPFLPRYKLFSTPPNFHLLFSLILSHSILVVYREIDKIWNCLLWNQIGESAMWSCSFILNFFRKRQIPKMGMCLTPLPIFPNRYMLDSLKFREITSWQSWQDGTIYGSAGALPYWGFVVYKHCMGDIIPYLWYDMKLYRTYGALEERISMQRGLHPRLCYFDFLHYCSGEQARSPRLL